MVQEVLEKNKGPKTINRKLEGGRKIMSSLKDTDGTEITDKQTICQTVEDFYSNLYDSNQIDWRPREDWDRKTNSVPPILPVEVNCAIEKMKNGKWSKLVEKRVYILRISNQTNQADKNGS